MERCYGRSRASTLLRTAPLALLVVATRADAQRPRALAATPRGVPTLTVASRDARVCVTVVNERVAILTVEGDSADAAMDDVIDPGVLEPGAGMVVMSAAGRVLSKPEELAPPAVPCETAVEDAVGIRVYTPIRWPQPASTGSEVRAADPEAMKPPPRTRSPE